MDEEGKVLIADLPEAESVADSSFIPVDNGNLTQKITVENFNASSNETAKAYAEAAANSATTAQEAIADVNNKVDIAQGYASSASESARNAQTHATNSQMYAGNSQGYANTAQGHATNAAASASAATGSADAANEAATLAKSFCQGGTGARQGENTNNAKYWASVAETAAQQHIDDHLDPSSTNPVQNRAIYDAINEMHTGGSIITVATSEQTLRGKEATITDGTTTYTATIDQTGKAVFEGVLLKGSLTISASDGTRKASTSLSVPYFGIYSASLAFWSADIVAATTTSEFNGLEVRAVKGGATLATATFSNGSATLNVPEAGSYVVETTLDIDYPKTFYSDTVSVSEQTAYNTTLNAFIATVSLTTPDTEFANSDIAVKLDGNDLTEIAFVSGAATFKALETGTFTFTVTYGGDDYPVSITVSSASTYSGVIKMWTATVSLTGSSQLQLQPISILKNIEGTYTEVGTAAFNAGGTASIIIHEAGTYKFSSDYDSYTYTSEAVVVSEETIYSSSITVFVATLSIGTNSAELYSQAISITNGTETINTVFSSGGSATVTVHETGTYTATVEYPPQSGTYYTDSATITTSGETQSMTIDTIPNGSTVTPTDTIQTWLKCAGLNKPYTTLSAVLADHDTLYLLMASDNAVDYLVRSTTWVSGITADEYAMKYIGKWNYASDTLLDDSTWLTGILGSTYFESVVNAKVPTISASSDKVISVNPNSSNPPWKAFDKNTSTYGVADAGTGSYIGYDFTDAVKVYRVSISSSSTSRTQSVKASNDRSTWTTLKSGISVGVSLGAVVVDIDDYAYTDGFRYYAVFADDNQNVAEYELQFYGRQDVTEGIDIYSAASDTVYYTEDGQDITICTTDTTGHGTVAKSLLPNGTYTLKSTVADDPSNLSNKYSKTVTITDGTSEIYLMPENTMYWYGYIGKNFESCTSSTGWSVSGGGSFSNPTYTTQYIQLTSSTGVTGMVGTSNKVNVTKVCVLQQGVTVVSNYYGRLSERPSKTITSPTNTVQITSTAITKYEITMTGENYATAHSSGGQTSKVYAMWTE